MSSMIVFRIVNFHRKSDALSICIILDTNGMEYRGMGYRHPQQEQDAPTGLESYPAIFYFPAVEFFSFFSFFSFSLFHFFAGLSLNLILLNRNDQQNSGQRS